MPAPVKSGSWFLELILNILLLSGVAFVTFSARGEQERGMAVPLFAAVSPATTRPATEAPAKAPSVPVSPNLPALKPPVDPNAVTKAVGQATDQGAQSFQQAWGTLQIWAAGLNGKITSDDLKKIQDSLSPGWTGPGSIRDYLKSVNDKINAGQADQLIQQSLKTLSQQANDKKIEAMDSVAQFMRAKGISWDQTQKIITQWTSQLLNMNPAELWKTMKF